MMIDKPFKTQYDARDRIQSHPGNPIKQLYAGSYNERGQVELKEDGTEDIYAFIQSFAESTDIHSILRFRINTYKSYYTDIIVYFIS